MKNLKPIYLSLTVLLFGSWILRRTFREENCFGLADGFFNLFLWIIGLVLLGISITKATKRNKDQQDRLELLPVLVVSVLLLIFISLSFLQPVLAGKPILHAATEHENVLTLRDDHTYLALLKRIDWGCTYSGEYTIQHDTLLIIGVSRMQCDTFHRRYLVGSHYLIPIIEGRPAKDSSLYFKIEYQNASIGK